MHSVYNKSEIYYVYDHRNQIKHLIGNKKDLLNFISKGFIDISSKDYYNWLNIYINGLIFNEKEIPEDYEAAYANNLIFYDLLAIKRYTFYDGFNRIVDIRAFFNEIIKMEISQMKYSGYRSNKFTYRKKRNNKGLKSRYNRASKKKLKAVNNDKEFKEFYKSKYNYNISRYKQGNWKEQSKTKKQWSKNTKDTKSIRKSYTQYDIELEFIEMDDEFYIND